MRKSFASLLLVMLSLIGYSQQVLAQTSALYQVPIESTSEAPVWYFLMSSDSKVVELPSTGASAKIISTPLSINSEGMFWRFEKNADGFKVINKAREGAFAPDFTWDNNGETILNITAADENAWSIANENGFLSANGSTATAVENNATLSEQFVFVKAPVVNALNGDLFYQMKSGRTTAPTYLTLEGGQIKWTSTSNINDYAQLFKFTNGEDGYYQITNLANAASRVKVSTFSGGNTSAGEKDQFYFNPRTDGYSYLCIKGEPNTTTIDYNGNGTCGFYGNRTVSSLNSGFQFFENEIVVDDLYLSIKLAEDLLTSTQEGIHPGQYSNEARVTLQKAIEAANKVLNNPNATTSEKVEAKVIIETATSAYTASKNTLKVSSGTTEYWYYIQAPRGATPDKVFSTNMGVDSQILNKEKASDNAQLWKIVANGSGFSLVNRADGSYVNTATSNNSLLKTVASVPSKALKFVENGTNNAAISLFLIEDNGSSVSFRIHAGASGHSWGLLNYTGNANDNCSFAFLTYDAGGQLGEAILAAQSVYSNSPEGNNPGFFTAESRRVFKAAIDAATLINESGASLEDKLAQVTVVEAAKEAFLASVNPIQLSTDEKNVWYYIISTASDTYAKGKVIVASSATEGGNYNFTNKSVDPNKLFRFVDAGNGKVAIQNRATGFFIAGNAKATATKTKMNALSLGQGQYNFKGDNYNPIHAQNSNSLLVTWDGGLNSASSWGLVELPEEDNNLPIAITSVSVTQGFTSTAIGNKNHPLLFTHINTEGLVGEILMKSIVMNLSASTNFNAVDKVKLFITTGDSRLNATTHEMIASVSAQDGNFEIILPEALKLNLGTTTICVAVDVAETAKEGQTIKGRILSVKLMDGTNVVVNKTTTHAATVFLDAAVLFSPGDGGSKYYRIPAIATAKDGSLVTVTDKRINHEGDLAADIDMVVRRSTDKGRTWTDTQVIVGEGTDIGYGDAAIVVDRETGKIIVVMVHDNGLWPSNHERPIRLIIMDSDDNGITWSEPRDVTSQVWGPGCENPISAKWLGMFIASGRGLQLRSGRIMFAMCVRTDKKPNGLDMFVTYTDDLGKTWNTNTNMVSPDGDESKLAERNDGSVVMSIRNPGVREWNVSPDGGMTWPTSTTHSELKDPNCNGEILTYTSTLDGYNKNRWMHSLCYAGSRSNVSMLLSYDEGKTWPIRKTICPGGSAYSTFTMLPDGTIGFYYEDQTLNADGFDMTYVRFSLDWLTNGEDKFDFPTSIEGTTTSKPTAYAEGGFIKVEGVTETARAYNMHGVEVDMKSKQPTGIYAVKAGDFSSVVIVK